MLIRALFSLPLFKKQSLKLSQKTEQFILDVAPKHFASLEGSPVTYEAVRTQAERYGIYWVFGGGSDDTIFSCKEVQLAYRAWHDSIHLRHELDFSKESELAVAKLQEIYALRAGMPERDAMLLRLDLEAHIEYHYAKGEHPVRQLELIADCMKHGVLPVVRGTKIYH